MNLQPPTDHQLLVFWVALLVLLVSARALGTLFKRIGQPAVIGELAAGLVLGPSFLGRIAPDVGAWLFPADDVQTAMLFTVGWLGVMLLLVGTGFETDLGLIRRLGRAATLVSMGSLVVPAAAGLAVGWFIPTTFVGANTERYIFALFIAAALSISSLPVIGKILSEMGLMRRNFGQLTLAAGMANDVIGWIGLGLIAGLAQAGGVKLDKLAFTVFGVAGFFVFAFTVGQRLVDASLRSVRANGDDPLAGLTVVLVTALTFGVITQWLHVEAVLGAFIAGVILARSRFADHQLIRPLETMTSAIFAPIFFATAGLRVDLGLLADSSTLLWAGLVLLAASASKFLGSMLGARLSSLRYREGAALGIGLNARGALEIVIATVGLSLGVLNDRSYTVIVLMAMATSMLAPPLLRRVLRGWDGSPEERKRLDLELQMESNTIVRGGRVLIPTRGGISSLLATQIAGLTWPITSEATLLTVGQATELDLSPFVNVLADRTVDHRFIDAKDSAQAILNEARLGYDALVIGAGTRDEGTLNPLIQQVLRHSPIPVVVVRPPRDMGTRLPWAFSRALIPVDGSRSSRGGQEIGTYLSSQIGTYLHLLYTTTTPMTTLETILVDHASAEGRGRRILNDAANNAAAAGARASTTIEHSSNPAERIVASAAELDTDLVVISGTIRVADGALSLGQTVEHVLKNVSTTLIIAFTPETSAARKSGAPSTSAQPDVAPFVGDSQ